MASTLHQNYLYLSKIEHYVKIEKNKWIKKVDIKKFNHIENNFTKIFKKFLNVKYVWGGKTFQGIDCSGLLQIFFYYNNSYLVQETQKIKLNI